MNQIAVFLRFYRKLFVPSLIWTAVLAVWQFYLIDTISPTFVAVNYSLAVLVLQYYFYEFRERTAYVFWYNLGWPRSRLWRATTGIDVILVFISIFL